MIGNAHLDPAWLWNPCDGIDAALATRAPRATCSTNSRISSSPAAGAGFTSRLNGMIRSSLHASRAHVDGGRWSLVGGMVVQPDCNLPCGESFARHFQQGQGYFRERFGRVANVGYNVDSFGHTAWLPSMLRAAGLDSYVFMRPMPDEMSLPSRVFRWRSPDGAEVPDFPDRTRLRLQASRPQRAHPRRDRQPSRRVRSDHVLLRGGRPRRRPDPRPDPVDRRRTSNGRRASGSSSAVPTGSSTRSATCLLKGFQWWTASCSTTPSAATAWKGASRSACAGPSSA